MREEAKLELQRKIEEKFDQALGKTPQASRQISEEERQARTARYADMLIEAAPPPQGLKPSPKRSRIIVSVEADSVFLAEAG